MVCGGREVFISGFKASAPVDRSDSHLCGLCVNGQRSGRDLSVREHTFFLDAC